MMNVMLINLKVIYYANLPFLVFKKVFFRLHVRFISALNRILNPKVSLI